MFVQTVGGYDALVDVTNLTTGTGPVTAKSLIGLLSLGAKQGHRIKLDGRGPDAATRGLRAPGTARGRVRGGHLGALLRPEGGAGAPRRPRSAPRRVRPAARGVRFLRQRWP